MNKMGSLCSKRSQCGSLKLINCGWESGLDVSGRCSLQTYRLLGLHLKLLLLVERGWFIDLRPNT